MIKHYSRSNKGRKGPALGLDTLSRHKRDYFREKQHEVSQSDGGSQSSTGGKSRKHVAVNNVAVQVPLTPIGMSLKQMTSLDSEVSRKRGSRKLALRKHSTSLVRFKFTPIY